MLADELDYVIGVDTHRDEHVLAVLTAAAGAVVAGEALPANARGYRETLRFAERYAAGRRAWAIEGTGSYGAGLARFLAGTWRDGARGQPHATSRAATTRQGRHARRGPDSARSTRQRHARAAAHGRAAGGAAAVACRSSQRH